MCPSLKLIRDLVNAISRNKWVFIIITFLVVCYQIRVIVQITKHPVSRNEGQNHEQYQLYEHEKLLKQQGTTITPAEHGNIQNSQQRKHLEHLAQNNRSKIPMGQNNGVNVSAEHRSHHEIGLQVVQKNKHIAQNNTPLWQARDNEATKTTWSSLKLIDPNRNTLDTMRKLEMIFSLSGYPLRNYTMDWYGWTQDVTFTYPDFKIHEPLFPSQKDRDLFYLHSENCEYANLTVQARRLTGIIRIIHQGFAHKRIDCGWSSNLTEFVDKDKRTKYTADIVVPLMTYDGFSFQHFMDGTFPKIIQVLPFLRLPNVTLVLETPRDKIIKQLLQEMNLYDRVIFVHPSEDITSRIQINTCITPPIHPLLWAGMRQELGIAHSFSIEPRYRKIILLTRAGNHNGGRNIQNHAEVTEYLSARFGLNFLVFKPLRDFQTTRQYFAKARIIIGVHGGAFYNLNFAPAGCHVIEVMPTTSDGKLDILRHTIFWRMADAIGQYYWRLNTPPVNNVKDVIFPLQQLENVLDKVEHYSM